MSERNNQIIWQKDNSWRLRVETAVLPDNTTQQSASIDHPGAVVLVPLQVGADGFELLMLHQYRHALDATIFELPAGTKGWDEDWLVCAQRELREETGYRAENFVLLGEVWPTPGLSNELMKIYLASGLKPDPLPQDVDEEITVVALPLSQLILMARDGRIRDAKSIIGILRTADHLNL